MKSPDHRVIESGALIIPMQTFPNDHIVLELLAVVTVFVIKISMVSCNVPAKWLVLGHLFGCNSVAIRLKCYSCISQLIL
jgi:hypothetical protein